MSKVSTIIKRNNKRGFTLIELLVVVAIIGILSSVVLASLNTARAKARDVKRKAGAYQLRTAIEAYYADNGSYPLASPGAWGGAYTAPCGTNSTNYISGLVPTYIASLPVDPSSTANCSGYLYNSNGQNYKLLIHGVWEEAYPTSGQQWYDPARPTWSLMLCSKEPACSTW